MNSARLFYFWGRASPALESGAGSGSMPDYATKPIPQQPTLSTVA